MTDTTIKPPFIEILKPANRDGNDRKTARRSFSHRCGLTRLSRQHARAAMSTMSRHATP